MTLPYCPRHRGNPDRPGERVGRDEGVVTVTGLAMPVTSASQCRGLVEIPAATSRMSVVPIIAQVRWFCSEFVGMTRVSRQCLPAHAKDSVAIARTDQESVFGILKGATVRRHLGRGETAKAEGSLRCQLPVPCGQTGVFLFCFYKSANIRFVSSEVVEMNDRL